MKSLPIYFLLVLASTSFAQNYTGDTWKNASKAGKAAVSVAYVQTPSFVYVDNSGKLTGICVDIINEFAEWAKENKKVTISLKFVGDGSNFRGMYDKVKASKGGVFGIGNVTITEERKKEVKFSPPFITNFAILITDNKIPNLAKLTDMPKTFAGLTAYTAKGTLNEKRMMEFKEKYYPGLPVTLTTTSQETLDKVLSDPKALAYLDLAFYLEAVKLKKSIKRHAIADKASEQFGFVMPLTSDWNEVITEFFEADGGFINSTKYKTILLKHLGEAGMKLMQSAAK